MYPPRIPPPRRGVSGAVVALIAVCCTGMGLMVGCGTGFAIGSGTPASTPAAASQPASPSEAAVSPSASPSPSKSSASPTRAPKVKVPNVVGHNHQLAQDELQAAGFYGLAEEDATGQGRVLVWDRNWVVVRQSPKAGTRVSTDATITLYSKKIGE